MLVNENISLGRVMDFWLSNVISFSSFTSYTTNDNGCFSLNHAYTDNQKVGIVFNMLLSMFTDISCRIIHKDSKKGMKSPYWLKLESTYTSFTS